MAMENFYPVGTIVKLKDNEANYMIMAHMVQDGQNDDSLRDYGGYLYPTGLLKDKQILAFNESLIIEVIHLGYVDQIHIEYMELIKIIYKIGEYSEFEYDVANIRTLDEFKEQLKNGEIKKLNNNENEEIL